MQVDVVEPGRAYSSISARYLLASGPWMTFSAILRFHDLDGLFEVGGSWQLLAEFARERGVRPDLMRRPQRRASSSVQQTVIWP